MKRRHLSVFAAVSISLLCFRMPASAQVTSNCGDSTGTRGRDVVCRCGDTVTTNTRLVKKDPVVRKACLADGLHVADGVSLNLGGRTIIGSRTGTGIVPGAGSSILNGKLRNFATGVAVNKGTVVLTDIAADANVNSGLVISSSAGASPEATLAGSLASVSDNGGPGIFVAAGAELEIAGASGQAKVLVLRNGGVGIEARGRLTAMNAKVGQNAEHGVLVESNDLVEFVDSQLNDNGRHPTGENPGKAGALVLRATAEFIWHGTSSVVRDNTGHGFILGHATDQSGMVIGRVLDSQIYANDIGVFVEQKNSTSLSTASTIVANNIYANRGSGVYIKTSYQAFDSNGLAFGANDIHRNAVTPLETNICVHELGASQSVSQIVFDGPIANTDVDFAVETGPDPVDYPEDHACYWGPEPGLTPIADSDACNDLNDPDGTVHHCVWNAALGQCRIAWDAGGSENAIDTCDFSRNRIWNYTVEPIGSQLIHRGIAGLNGAFVRARRNQVGRGGESEFTAVDSGVGSWVDPGRICGQESTCNQYDQLPRD
jgi:hypothetical protein